MIESRLELFTEHVNKTSARRSASPEVGIAKEEKIKAKLFRRINAQKKIFTKVLGDPGSTMEVQGEPIISKTYNEVFKQGSVCLWCGKIQSWYLYFAKPVGSTPQVEWGENSFELVGAADTMAEVHREQLKTKIETWIFDADANTDVGKLLETLSENSHLNIINITGFNESTPQIEYQTLRTFDVLVEDFEGVAFVVHTRWGVKEAVYQDLVLQLADALEFLHECDPPITYNGLTPDNILVGVQNRLVLTNFKHARFNLSPKKDIRMLGDLMGSISTKYRRKYKKVIRKCGGTYNSISEMREDFKKAMAPQNEKMTLLAAVILVVCFVVLMVVIYSHFTHVNKTWPDLWRTQHPATENCY